VEVVDDESKCSRKIATSFIVVAQLVKHKILEKLHAGVL
jgi:hypothetical protein